MKDWSQQLKTIKEKGLYRSLKIITEAQTPRTVVDGQEVIMMASNNYLGLSTKQQVKDKAIEALKSYGTGSGGSRLTNGNYDLHQQLEERIAEFKGREAALVFNTGYMANLGTISTLASKDDLILSDSLNHASIIDGCKLSSAEVEIYQHCDLDDLEKRLKGNISNYKQIFIITDGVFSMDGDLTPLVEIVELAEEYGALVIVDDAHGTGVLGAKGKGIVEYFDLNQEVDIQIGTLSKALASEGGFVVGSQDLIDLLRNRARSFIYSTALAPPVVAASLAAVNYLDDHPELIKKLQDNLKFLKEGLTELGYDLLAGDSAIIPIMLGSEQRALKLSNQLLEQGILAPAIRPPTVPQGTSRIRITVMASHSRQDLEEVLAAFAAVKD